MSGSAASGPDAASGDPTRPGHPSPKGPGPNAFGPREPEPPYPDPLDAPLEDDQYHLIPAPTDPNVMTSYSPTDPSGPDGQIDQAPRRPKFLRGEPATEPVPLVASLRRTPYRDPHQMAAPEAAEERAALDLAVRVGELLLRCGAGTRDVDSSVLAVAAAAGFDRVEVDITSQSLLVQATTDVGTITVLRVVRSSTRDYARLVEVHRFVEALVAGRIGREEAGRRLKQIRRARRRWPRWSVSAAYGLLAASVALLLGAHLAAVGLSLVSAAGIDQVGRFLGRRDLPSFYLSAVGGAVATVFAWGALWLSTTGVYAMSTADFAFVVAGGIVVLLPGLATTASVEDAVNGYPVTGIGRLFGVGLTSAGIIVGVALGLSVTLRIGSALDLGLSSPTPLSFAQRPTPLVLVLVAGLVGAAASSMANRTLPTLILPAGMLGAFGAGGTALLHDRLGIGGLSSVAVACAVMGFIGRLLALRLGAPALVLVVPAIAPLLPGLAIFHGMYQLVSGSVVGGSAAALTPSVGIATLLGAMATALAIATGLIFGDVLSAPFDRRIVRRRRTRRR